VITNGNARSIGLADILVRVAAKAWYVFLLFIGTSLAHEG
jgi:hypothetical protein